MKRVSSSRDAGPNRIDIGDLTGIQQWAEQLGVSAVDLLVATRAVGTWVPAVERYLRLSAPGLPPALRE